MSCGFCFTVCFEANEAKAPGRAILVESNSHVRQCTIWGVCLLKMLAQLLWGEVGWKIFDNKARHDHAGGGGYTFGPS
jgi:hypothetical protein